MARITFELFDFVLIQRVLYKAQWQLALQMKAQSSRRATVCGAWLLCIFMGVIKGMFELLSQYTEHCWTHYSLSWYSSIFFPFYNLKCSQSAYFSAGSTIVFVIFRFYVLRMVLRVSFMRFVLNWYHSYLLVCHSHGCDSNALEWRRMFYLGWTVVMVCLFSKWVLTVVVEGNGGLNGSALAVNRIPIDFLAVHFPSCWCV